MSAKNVQYEQQVEDSDDDEEYEPTEQGKLSQVIIDIFVLIF